MKESATKKRKTQDNGNVAVGREKKKKLETSSYKGEEENDSLFFSLRPLFLKGGEQ